MGRNMQERLKVFWEWAKRTFTPTYQSEVESYLAQADDLYDLERRMLFIQRRGML